MYCIISNMYDSEGQKVWRCYPNSWHGLCCLTTPVFRRNVPGHTIDPSDVVITQQTHAEVMYFWQNVSYVTIYSTTICSVQVKA